MILVSSHQRRFAIPYSPYVAPELVWQIISMCTWLVSFTEKMMKACVLLCHVMVNEKEGCVHDGALSPLFLSSVQSYSCLFCPIRINFDYADSLAPHPSFCFSRCP